MIFWICYCWSCWYDSIFIGPVVCVDVCCYCFASKSNLMSNLTKLNVVNIVAVAVAVIVGVGEVV